MKRTINRLRVELNLSGTMREQLRVGIIGGPHASCAFQGIYLPYICHVPNCITRYVGFLYKMALRSHRLCCHRSICRGMLLSSLISLPFTLSLSLPLAFSPFLFFSSRASLSRTYTHTRVLRLALSPYGSRPCRSFIIHTALKVEHLLADQSRNARTVRRKMPFTAVGEFSKINRKVERNISPVRAAKKVARFNARKRERGKCWQQRKERRRQMKKERKREKGR